VFGKYVILQTHGKDKHGRTLADVLLADGTNVNHALVKDGWWWWYRKYAPADIELERLEKEAREAKKGLWANPNPVPSWGGRRFETYWQPDQCNSLLELLLTCRSGDQPYPVFPLEPFSHVSTV
jgi:hypothetical protein